MRNNYFFIRRYLIFEAYHNLVKSCNFVETSYNKYWIAVVNLLHNWIEIGRCDISVIAVNLAKPQRDDLIASKVIIILLSIKVLL